MREVILAVLFLCGSIVAEELAHPVPSKGRASLRLELLEEVPLPYGRPWDMIMSKERKRLYIANGAGGLVIVDISRPRKPEITGRFITGGTQFKTLVGRKWILDYTREARAIRWVGGEPRLYTHSKGYDVKHWKELRFDLRDERNPRLISERIVTSIPEKPPTKTLPILEGSGSFLVAIPKGKFLFALVPRGLEVYENWERVSWLPLAGCASDVEVVGEKVFVACGKSGVWSCKKSKFAEIRPIEVPPGNYRNITAQDRYIYCAGGGEGLVILKDGLLASYKSRSGEVWDVDVSGRTAYLAVRGFGMEIVDVFDPRQPRLLGRFRPNLPPSMSAGPEDRSRDNAFSVISDGKTTFLANGRSGVYEVDVSNPRRPIYRGRFWDKETGRMMATRMRFVPPFLYLADNDNGIYILDTSKRIVKKALLHTAQPFGFSLDRERIWVADGGYGLVCLERKTGRVLGAYREEKCYFQDVEVEDELIYAVGGWKLAVFRVAGYESPRPSAFTFDSEGKSRPLLDANHNPIKPEDVERLYGKEFVVKVNGEDVCGDEYTGHQLAYGRIRPVFQNLSGKWWMDAEVKPMTLAIDPRVGRFKFSDGRRGQTRLLGIRKIAMGIPSWFRVRDRYVYFGADEGLNFWIIDVSDPKKPRFVGNCCTGGFTKSIDVEGRFGFAANGMGQVIIYDLRNPSNPQPVSYINVPSYYPEADGKRLYISGGGKLYVYDISRITSPKFLSEINSVSRIIAEGGLLYARRAGRVEVLDLSNPGSPIVLSSYTDVLTFEARARRLGIMQKEGWSLYDLTNPRSPKRLYHLRIPRISGFDWDETYLYGTEKRDIVIYRLRDGFEAGRITRRNRPVTLGFGGGQYGYFRVKVKDKLLYALDIKVGLVIFDVRNPSAPRKLSEFLVLGGDHTGTAYDSRTRIAYSATNWGGLHLTDLTDPTRPRPLAWHQLEGACGPTLFEKSIAFGNNAGWLCVADISDPLRVSLVSRFDTGRRGDPRLGGGNFSVKIGNLLYLPERCTILDISNPAEPKLLGRLPAEKGFAGYTIWVSDGYAYIGGSPHFLVVDVRDPLNPTEVGRLNLEAYHQPGWGGYYFGRGIYQRGNHVYTLSRAEFFVLDVSKKTSPRILSRLELPGFPSDLDLVGNYAYIADYYGGLHIIDISDPAHPILLDHFQQGAYYDKGGWDNVACYQTIKVTSDFALLSEYYSGLMVVQVPYASEAPLGTVMVECRLGSLR